MTKNHLYIIAGCNGAGKTTVFFNILPNLLNCKEFVNADAIAAALSPFQPETVAFEAGRIMLKRIDELLDKQVDFAIETTLATKSYKSLIERAKEKNYHITLLFFWLSSSQMAVQRVASRVEKGGHHIPTDVIHRRYERGIKNLFEIYLDICDKVSIFDSTNQKLELLARKRLSSELEIIKENKILSMKTKITIVEDPAALYFDKFDQRIMDAMEIHSQKLIQQTIKDNSYLIVCDDDGNIIRETAEDLKKMYPQYA
jgi:predicted ABC-type ATPase